MEKSLMRHGKPRDRGSKQDTTQSYKITSGILEVGPKGEVVVLCDEAVETPPPASRS